MQEEFKRIPLKDIEPDQNQPRKHFDEKLLGELAHSISQYDVIEPIMVRPAKSKNGKYIIVVGERRFRAAGMAMLADIPAIIRKLSDSEALEVQITENLQRENVNPMEEAEALKTILDSKRYKPKELAARIGKKVDYVLQRVKLCELIPEFQDLVYADKIKLTQAYLVCRFSADVQRGFFSSYVPDDWKDQPAGWKVRDIYFGNTTHNLDEAPFKTEDPTLNPKMGVCGNCRFNSRVTELQFEGAENSRICSNPSCYEIKTKNSFLQKVQEVSTDESIALVSQYTYTDHARRKVKEAEETVGRPVLTDGAWELLEEPAQPEMPTYEAFKKEYEDDWEGDPEKLSLLEASWKKTLQEWEDKMLDWQDMLKDYKFKKEHATKAFVVNGSSDCEGKIVEVYIKGSEDGANPESIGLKKKIDELRERNKKAVEKDKITLLKAQEANLFEVNTYSGREEPLELVEWLPLFYLLYKNAGYALRSQIGKDWGREDIKPQQLLQEIVSTGRTSFLFRWMRCMLLKEVCTGQFDYDSQGLSTSNFLVNQIATRYIPVVAEKTKADIKQKATERLAKMNEKIAGLQQTEIEAA